ncbi:hypothetical protein HBI25_045850 [Parastagonospora nodorum]|nr:hypothetical protein HBI06_086310 [Parastagonospora nodorum]KAH4245529.1 hypothetical protein HBI05_069440 [Parastagonospora nodorum]KAH4856114.1 hypothetical protein HBH75_074690 [Parastagonospora nodorum]KAH4987559.1 hypothetical protein HBI76_099790 [Parastagonospora nodorum]KAH5023236.1 hypothetical protein HBI74_134750 [Parastagonospora nodorum]
MASKTPNTDDVVVWLETKNVERRATYVDGPLVTTEDSLSHLRDALVMRGFSRANFHQFKQALLDTNQSLLRVTINEVTCVLEINKVIAEVIRATITGSPIDLFTVRCPFLPKDMSVDEVHEATHSITISGGERFNLGFAISTFLTLDEAVEHMNVLLQKGFEKEEYHQAWNDGYPRGTGQKRVVPIREDLGVLTGIVASTYTGVGMKLWKMATVTRIPVQKGKGQDEYDLRSEELSGPLLLKWREFSK